MVNTEVIDSIQFLANEVLNLVTYDPVQLIAHV